MKFYQMSAKDRRQLLRSQGIKLTKVNENELKKLEQLSENVVGQISLPLGLVGKLVVNDRNYLVPMATEEPSVVAAANHGAKIFAQNGSVEAKSVRNGIYGQIVLRVKADFSLSQFEAKFPELLNLVNDEFASLVNHGGGVKEITARREADLLFLRVLVDPAEAMGANKVNTILEFLGKKITELPGIVEKLFAILTNCPSQLTAAKVELEPAMIGGHDVAKKIALLSKIGQADPDRGVTNNKGIMNGVDAVLLATGNDFRAVEAATAVFASSGGRYHSLSKWQLKDEKLVGELTLPLPLGTVGGSIDSRADIQQSFNILGSGITSSELANVTASIGLANNFAALLAISTEGIQAGHMKLQARNVVARLTASEEEKKAVLREMIATEKYSEQASKDILKELRRNN
ncbi:hydroxymethylglutaryl-CoA reductase, degradative [Lactobacillus sp. ESL0791]|uniref:hydroxymethylglutaryl-CoA reductase, degradative n=1 Tax=Lactobacillus sp. ESL0791 TaxID=2983234 RepID=UPI0023FA0C31|nr:hydroxymethylglutaryl-CoA reductase, degradative [Lactobacillus sp. ESL0791]MDF7638529.1 hydroxymethylglutaryl-CoA reductase, degradative [Lactobacillus sp. ESL0791]